MLKLVSLVTVLDDEGVEVLGAANLELERTVLLLLDCYAAGILAARGHQEILDFMHLLRLQIGNAVDACRENGTEMAR